MTSATTWQTDDRCPACGTGLAVTGHGQPVTRQDCPACGWSATWQADPDGRDGDDPGPVARTTRAERMAQPLLRDVIRDVAEQHGACIRPIQLRKTNLDTGTVEQVLIPCGATLASVCPPCAERAKTLRAAQCREGWHLEHEPAATSGPPDDWQRWLAATLADLLAARDQAAERGQDLADLDGQIDAVLGELRRTGIRGTLRGTGTDSTTGAEGTAKSKPRRKRSTRRRQDAPDLPRRKVTARTIGRTFTARTGKTYRPSMFLTLTCDSYGPVRDDGTPADPASYDYTRAAQDAVHFAALLDRFIQNLRRFLGYDIQYFATIEPQRRLAPHAHIALRGAVSRSDLRRVIAATYHQVWWPSTDRVCYDADHMPAWDETRRRYVDRRPGSCCRPGMRRWTRSACTMTRCTWPGWAASSRARACSPPAATPPSASAT
jgi:hypothetical protein